MNTLQRILASAILVTPITAAGCRDLKHTDLKANQTQDSKERSQTVFFNGYDPLVDYRRVVPGIHLFDIDNNGILDQEEVRKLITIHVLNDNTLLIDQSTVDKLKDIEDKLREASVTKTTQGLMFAENIGKTLQEIQSARKKMQEQVYDKQDKEVRKRLEKLSSYLYLKSFK